MERGTQREDGILKKKGDRLAVSVNACRSVLRTCTVSRVTDH